jgi:Rrf2 family iron-sulfur cluster assembly transcriptional regulator
MDAVSVADIIHAVDEPLDATSCGGKENCQDDQRCMTHDLWTRLNERMIDYLRSVHLAELVAQQKARQENAAIMRYQRPSTRDACPSSAV